MLEALTPQTIQVLAAGKLLLAGVFALGAGAFRWFLRPRRWWLLALAVAGSLLILQALIFSNAASLFNQLRGDDLYVTAFYQRVISDGVGHDFAYPRLPPHYPPLYFSVIGLAARGLGLNGVGAARLGVAVAIALVPLVVGLWWRVRRRDDADPVPASPVLPLLLVLLAFVAVEFPAVLTKPYEFISALVALLWFVATHHAFSAATPVRWWRVVLAGAIGAGLLATYYLWVILAAIAGVAAAAAVPWRDSRRYLIRWAAAAAVAAAGSAWYWLPLVLSYQRLGMENWLPAFFIPSDLDLFPPLALTPRAVILWIGVASALAYRRRAAVRPAAYLLAATYLWQAVSLVSLATAATPFEAARGFTFLGEITLAYTAAYAGAAWIGVAADRVRDLRWLLVWVAVAVSLPFGFWLDAVDVRQRLNDLPAPDGDLPPFVQYFSRHPAEAKLTTLVFLPKLNAYVALPLYLYHNQHAGHPAANFTRRLEYLRGLATARTPAEFAQRFAAENPYEPIEQLILYAVGDTYELYFWLDDYPNGGREAVIRWPRALIAAPYFTPIPELSVGGFYAWRPAAPR